MLKIKNIVYNEAVLVIKGLSLEVNEGEIVSREQMEQESLHIKIYISLLKTEDGETTKAVFF